MISVTNDGDGARRAVSFFNQIKKMGMAVQRGIVNNIEIHITAAASIDQKVVDFIKSTIPNVKI